MVVTKENMAEHVRVWPGDSHSGGFSEVPQAPGGGVAVHPRAAAVKQNRPAETAADRPVDGPADRWRQGNQDDLGSLAAHTQHPVAVLFTKVGDVGPGGLEDPQAQQPKHGHQREVAGLGGLTGRSQQGLELQMSKTEGRRLGGH
jgi:hypothetical protein